MFMNVNILAISTAVDIPIYTSMEEIQTVTSQDSDLQRLKSYIIQGWPHTKDEVQHSMQKGWPVRHELVVIGWYCHERQKSNHCGLYLFLCRRWLVHWAHSSGGQKTIKLAAW